jgi:hypothetical protein
MLNFCGIVVAILKMATGRNLSRSGIISGHQYLPTYQILPPMFYAVFWQPFLYEIPTFPQDSIVTPTPFEPLKIRLYPPLPQS